MRNFKYLRRFSCFCLPLCLAVTVQAQTLKLKPGATPTPQSPASQAAIPPPDDLSQPPDDAIREASGLVTRLLKPGNGKRVTRNDMITVQYTVWTDDGKTLDTTEGRNPRTFRLRRGMEGFQEAVALMVVGETRRAWVPEELAYKGVPNRPQGTLVFDVELIDLESGPLPPVDVAAVPDTAQQTDSGLAFRVLQPGEGDSRPGPNDVVVANFNTWTTEGVLIDDTFFDEEPTSFDLSKTIPGFLETFCDMRVNEKRRIWLPPRLTELDGKASFDTLTVIDVELLSFMSRPVTPEDVSGPPPGAATTPLGVSYRILREGQGDRYPDYDDTVEVNYAGWTRDGEMFDASYKHGRAGSFKLDNTMPLGWVDAIRGMVIGEKRRVWIPRELAYGDQEDRPQGMLIFDLELVAIRD